MENIKNCKCVTWCWEASLTSIPWFLDSNMFVIESIILVLGPDNISYPLGPSYSLARPCCQARTTTRWLFDSSLRTCISRIVCGEYSCHTTFLCLVQEIYPHNTLPPNLVNGLSILFLSYIWLFNEDFSYQPETHAHLFFKLRCSKFCLL